MCLLWKLTAAATLRFESLRAWDPRTPARRARFANRSVIASVGERPVRVFMRVYTLYARKNHNAGEERWREREREC